MKNFNFREWNTILRHLTMLGQLGLSLIMPVLMCMGGCWLLCTKLGLGLWVYIPGFILGLGSSGVTAYKTWQQVMKKDAKKDQENVSFNRHF